jgi:hypothetical protein
MVSVEKESSLVLLEPCNLDSQTPQVRNRGGLVQRAPNGAMAVRWSSLSLHNERKPCMDCPRVCSSVNYFPSPAFLLYRLRCSVLLVDLQWSTSPCQTKKVTRAW